MKCLIKTFASACLLLSGDVLFADDQGPISNGQAIPTSNQGAILWQEFRFGMSMEDAVAVLRGMPEIKSAQIKTSKGKPSKIDVDYTSDGVKIFGQLFRISLIFNDKPLDLVSLKTKQSCLSYRLSDHKKMADALAVKYPTKVYSSNSIVTATGTPASVILTDGMTRVQLELDISDLPELPKVPRKQFENTTDWNYVFAKGRYDAAVQERQDRLYQCPDSDYGAYASISITYADEADQVRLVLEKQKAEQMKRLQEDSRAQNEADKL